MLGKRGIIFTISVFIILMGALTLVGALDRRADVRDASLLDDMAALSLTTARDDIWWGFLKNAGFVNFTISSNSSSRNVTFAGVAPLSPNTAVADQITDYFSTYDTYISSMNNIELEHPATVEWDMVVQPYTSRMTFDGQNMTVRSIDGSTPLQSITVELHFDSDVAVVDGWVESPIAGNPYITLIVVDTGGTEVISKQMLDTFGISYSLAGSVLIGFGQDVQPGTFRIFALEDTNLTRLSLVYDVPSTTDAWIETYQGINLTLGDHNITGPLVMQKV